MSISYHEIEYLVRAAKLDIGDACIKDEPKTNCIQQLCGVERIALYTFFTYNVQIDIIPI